MSVVARVVGVVREMARRASEERVTFLAAAVAYYAFVSLVPLLLLVFAVGSAVGGEEFATAILRQTRSLLAPSGEELVREAVLSASGRTGATIVGTALLLWSGLKLFRGLDEAFSTVYGVEGTDTLPRQVADALLVLLVIGVAAVAAVVVGGLVPAWDLVPLADLVSLVGLPVVLFVAFLPMYYAFPDVDVTVPEVVPGAAFAALGWTVLAEGFQFYAANAAQYDVYGVLGGVLLLGTWLYLAAIVIITGALLNAVLSATPGRDASDEEAGDDETAEPAPDVAELGRELREVRERLDEKTVSRSALESDLKRYVRGRIRRGHARGWGPYLVLLYGTGMTIGAFYFLAGVWAILAMVVIWLSTLGLYVVMLAVGAGIGLLGLPGRVTDRVREWRSGS